MNRIKLASILRPITTRLPRGGRKINEFIMGKRRHSEQVEQDALYRSLIPPGERTRLFRDRVTGCDVIADITDWAGRSHYLNARYYDSTVPRIAATILKQGCRFIDVGANRGLHTIAVAKILGPTSEIFAIEPNPEMVEVIKKHLQMNGLDWCQIMEYGIGSEEGKLRLNQFQDEHSGGYSFIPHKAVKDTIEVQVTTLDKLFKSTDFNVPTFIKIDIEGYEYKALLGMDTILRTQHTSIYSEISPTLLKEPGAAEVDLFSLLYDYGYKSYLIKTSRSMWGKETIGFEEFSGPTNDARQYDAFFSKTPPSASS